MSERSRLQGHATSRLGQQTVCEAPTSPPLSQACALRSGRLGPVTGLKSHDSDPGATSSGPLQGWERRRGAPREGLERAAGGGFQRRGSPTTADPRRRGAGLGACGRGWGRHGPEHAEGFNHCFEAT